MLAEVDGGGKGKRHQHDLIHPLIHLESPASSGLETDTSSEQGVQFYDRSEPSQDDASSPAAALANGISGAAPAGMSPQAAVRGPGAQGESDRKRSAASAGLPDGPSQAPAKAAKVAADGLPAPGNGGVQERSETGSTKAEKAMAGKDASRLAALVTLNQPIGADDPVGLQHTLTTELASMDVWRMRRALLCLAATAPAVAEAFLIRALTPAAAQLLTHRFEQADSVLLSSGRSKDHQSFYTGLYGACTDTQAVLHRLLHLKERYCEQQLLGLLQQHFCFTSNGA
ncbi:hypothetical protein WJX84_000586 [Apatococcus fuscideae]|uniref:Uncharacterized protein n=1 Tax=Apatococcus fuscideae TaxID=2026836 RepID=A0AAW1SWC4_9CHLO